MSPMKPGARSSANSINHKLTVRITHGDLQHAQHPVLIGHYEGDSINGSERVLDNSILGGKLQTRRRLGIYPGACETAHVALGPELKARAIVVGLGIVGDLAPGNLRKTITHGLIAYALHEAEALAYAKRSGPSDHTAPGTETTGQVENTLNAAGDSRDEAGESQSDESMLTVTALLVGSGDGGVSIEDSVNSIIEGAARANLTLANLPVRIAEIELLELHQDRAVAVSKMLKKLSERKDNPLELHITWPVGDGRGGWRRVAYQADHDWWTRIQITTTEDGFLKFVSLTESARAEEQRLPLQYESMDALLCQATENLAQNDALGRTLFELLLPNRIKDAAPKNRKVVLIVDKQSATFPWELLQDGFDPASEPLAVRSGMVRQMQTWNFAETVVSTSENTALVIGDPITLQFPRLPGAAAEAIAVKKLLTESKQPKFHVKSVIGGEFDDILTKLFEYPPYKILHLAGHGVYEHTVGPAGADAQDSEFSQVKRRHKSETVTGMVLADRVFLTPAEVAQMRVVPELVFINCCHLGKETGDREGLDHRFHQLAANLGTQLIEMGAKAVVAAGWAVEDDAAQLFAEAFYGQMLLGDSFGNAVQTARRKVWQRPENRSNTWGAYQCYGDPAYVLVSEDRTRKHGGDDKPSVVDEAIFTLENIGNDAVRLTGTDLQQHQQRLYDYAGFLLDKWMTDARLLESLGKAYGEVGMYEEAVRYYERAATTEKATLSVKSLEQFANLRCRWTVQLWRDSRGDKPSKHALEVINSAISDIKLLLKVGKTIERYSLLASAYKRKALVTRGDERDAALKKMEQYYKKAEELFRQQKKKSDYYSTLNRLTASVLRQCRQTGSQIRDLDKCIEEIKKDARSGQNKDLSFWNAIALVDADLVRYLGQAKSDGRVCCRIAKDYKAQRRRATSREFHSVTEHIQFLAEMLEESTNGGRATRGLAADLRSILNELGDAEGAD